MLTTATAFGAICEPEWLPKRALPSAQGITNNPAAMAGIGVNSLCVQLR